MDGRRDNAILNFVPYLNHTTIIVLKSYISCICKTEEASQNLWTYLRKGIKEKPQLKNNTDLFSLCMYIKV